MNNLQNTFNFEGLFEGKIIEVQDNNECLISIPKLFFDNYDSKYEVEESINNDNIINNDLNKQTITSVNGIYCKPFYANGVTRKMNEGEEVTVFFKDGDPQNAYYINGYFAKQIEEYTNDSIYENKDIKIYTEQGDTPKILFKIKDTIVEITENGIAGGNGNGNGGILGGGGIGTDEVVSIVTKDMYIKDIIADGKFDPSEKKFINKELDKISKEYICIIKIFDFYKNSDSNEEIKKNYTKYKEELIEYLNPMLKDMNSTEDIDGKEFEEKFKNYYDNRNKILSTLVDILIDVNDKSIKYVNSATFDNILSVSEKTNISNIFDILKKEKPYIEELANLFSILSNSYNESY